MVQISHKTWILMGVFYLFQKEVKMNPNQEKELLWLRSDTSTEDFPDSGKFVFFVCLFLFKILTHSCECWYISIPQYWDCNWCRGVRAGAYMRDGKVAGESPGLLVFMGLSKGGGSVAQPGPE